jgi:hypothetical protein
MTTLCALLALSIAASVATECSQSGPLGNLPPPLGAGCCSAATNILINNAHLSGCDWTTAGWSNPSCRKATKAYCGEDSCKAWASQFSDDPCGEAWYLFVVIGFGALAALCCTLRICKACKDCERDREVAAQRAQINAINAGLIANQQQVGIMSHAQFLANQQQAATTPPISFAAPTPPIQTAVPVGTADVSGGGVTSYPDVEAAETPEAMLVKLKSLLDAGVLTQEEFDNKKAEILKRF